MNSSVEPMVLDIDPSTIISEFNCVLDLDLMQAPADFDSFSSDFTLIGNQSGVFRGLVAWFDAEMTSDHWFSTSPAHGSTHWHQTFFPAKDRFGVSEGSVIQGRISCRPHPSNYRGLQIEIKVIEPIMGRQSSLIYDWE